MTAHYPGGLSPPREDYHPPLPWGHLERIITFHYPGGLSPPMEKITTSHYPRGPSIILLIGPSSLINLGDYNPLERVITSHYPGGVSPQGELSPLPLRILDYYSHT